MSPSNCNGVTSLPNGNQNYIEHTVSKYDTLAGVAIKYGVEVADIKRLNNLATDLQMFALKVLRIPLPGRHPPSPDLPNGFTNSGESSSSKTLPHEGHSNMLESFRPLRSKSPQKNVSSAMDTLLKYYGLKSPNLKDATKAQGMEMAVYSNRTSDYIDDGLLPRASSVSDILSNHHHKSRSLVNGFLSHDGGTVEDEPALEEAGDGEAERSSEKRVRRRQKSEVDSWPWTPERLLKEENGGGRRSSDFSPTTGKGLALRPKSATRSSPVTDAESGWLGTIPMGLGDSILTDGFSSVRKSSSMPSLPDQESSSSSSVWPAPKWSLKADLQVLSAASITRPIFDGLPKPITGRWNKAALD